MMRTTHMPIVGLSRVLMSVSLLLTILAPVASVAIAQHTGTDFDPEPLRPADTSSPRATLSSFLTNVIEAIEAWRRDNGELTERSYRPYSRAVQTLDFSATPDGSSSVVRTQRILFLKEILDRLELPPDAEIPGAEEVAEGVAEWTIPGTRIKIRRI